MSPWTSEKLMHELFPGSNLPSPLLVLIHKSPLASGTIPYTKLLGMPSFLEKLSTLPVLRFMYNKPDPVVAIHKSVFVG